MGDIFSAIGIILVFATVGLDVYAKEATVFISKNNPDKDKPTEVINFKKEKRNVILKLIGVFIFYLILFWLLLPKSIKIIKNSELALWNFDMVQTFYVLINIGVLIFMGLTFSFICRTFRK